MTDATTTCPACGGSIHAVAGRCKHCKTDLVALREARGPRAAPAPLPERSPPVAAPAPRRPPPSRGSLWAQRWPLAVSVVALASITVSGGILAERWLTRDDSQRRAGTAAASRSPHPVPDPLDQTVPPRAPHSPPRPTPVPAPDPPDPDLRAAPPPGGEPADVQVFVSALTDSLCRKLDECGLIDGASRSMCAMMAQSLEEGAALDRQADCRFDRSAARRCLDAVEALDCDTGSGTDVLDWLLAAQSLTDCSKAYSCP